jgi:hypothetical protein
MENNIFKKMKAKQGQKALVINAPKNYPCDNSVLEFTLVDFANIHSKNGTQKNFFDFVHLFISSKNDFETYVQKALEKCMADGLFWVSYPKAKGKNKPDINRDSLWDLSLSFGIHPVAQVAIDDAWSALRFVKNKPGENYDRPVKAAKK